VAAITPGACRLGSKQGARRGSAGQRATTPGRPYETVSRDHRAATRHPLPASGRGTGGEVKPKGGPMSRDLRIRRLTVHQYRYTLEDMGYDYNGFNHVYLKGNHLEQGGYVFTIETDAGITGEYVGGNSVSYAQVAMVAQYLIGKNALEREIIWNDIKRALRK